MHQGVLLEIIMKYVVFLILCLQMCFCNICAESESEKILADVWRRMDAVPLPDGYSIFGRRITETTLFDTDHLGSDGLAAFYLSKDWIHTLRKPVKSSSIIWGDTYYSAAEYMSLYMSLVKTFYNLTPDTVLFFERLFQYGEICGIKIPGLDITTPISRVRGELFKVLGNWRVHGEASKADALEAIRIERERLDAIAAEEEAKRKAEAEAKAAEQAARIAATEARYNAVRKPSTADEAATSTLRHRRATKMNDQRAEEKQPLLRPIRAH